MDKMLEDLKTHEGEKQHVLQSWFIDPLTTLDEELSKFKELIQTTLDLEMAGKGEYVVQADFDESLLGNLYICIIYWLILISINL